MKLTELEKSVIESMLADVALSPTRVLRTDAVVVLDRELTGAGFITELRRSPELKLFGDSASMRWGRVGARLNAAKIETSYLLYVDDGYLTTVEGYTYGEEWPSSIEEIELYELATKTELAKPST